MVITALQASDLKQTHKESSGLKHVFEHSNSPLTWDNGVAAQHKNNCNSLLVNINLYHALTFMV